MCLMCEWYLDSCEHPACVEAAAPHDRYSMKSGTRLYLWRGVGRPLCPDMVARHKTECACLVVGEYEECDCDAA